MGGQKKLEELVPLSFILLNLNISTQERCSAKNMICRYSILQMKPMDYKYGLNENISSEFLIKQLKM